MTTRPTADRRGAARAADRLRARPAGHRAEGLLRARSCSQQRLGDARRRRDRRTIRTLEDGLPREAGASTASPATWRGACRSLRRDRRARTTAATRRASGRSARDGADLERASRALPGFGEMKVKALGAVLAKRFGVAAGASSSRRRTRRSATSTRRRRSPSTRRPSAPARPRCAPRRRCACIELRTLTDGGQTAAEIARELADVPRRGAADASTSRSTTCGFRDRRRRDRPATRSPAQQRAASRSGSPTTSTTPARSPCRRRRRREPEADRVAAVPDRARSPASPT